MTIKKIKRGEVWWVNFDPSISGEIKKIRPALVVSNDYANEYSNRAQVVPLTSNVDRCYPCEAYITVDGKKYNSNGLSIKVLPADDNSSTKSGK